MRGHVVTAGYEGEGRGPTFTTAAARAIADAEDIGEADDEEFAHVSD
jgi:hypothetical protein